MEDRNSIAIRVFDTHAKTYQEKFMAVDLYHEALDAFCIAVEAENAEVLELGCGPGNITQYLQKRRPDLRILATDLSPNMLELAQANNPQASCQLLDLRNVTQLGRKFDAIVCGFCLPYLSPEETHTLLRDAAGMLHARGALYLSTMEDDPAKSGFKLPSSGQGEAAYVQFYQAEFLVDALRENGLTVTHLSRKVYPAPDGSTTTDVMIVARN